MEKIKQKPGNKRKYDFPSLINVGDSLVILGGNVKGIRSAAIMYSKIHHSGAWKFKVTSMLNERNDYTVEVRRVA